MRKSREAAADTRRKIVDAAADSFRRTGIHATGLSNVMSDAGLTHGGFYRHFRSKDQLVAEACVAGIGDIVAALKDSADKKAGKDAFLAVVARYLSTEHRNNVTKGCPIAALGSELAREDKETRLAASTGVEELVDLVLQHSGRDHAHAVVTVAAMIGAVTMSRIIYEKMDSDSVLRYVKSHLAEI